MGLVGMCFSLVNVCSICCTAFCSNEEPQYMKLSWFEPDPPPQAETPAPRANAPPALSTFLRLNPVIATPRLSVSTPALRHRRGSPTGGTESRSIRPAHRPG